jgi:hypothetical protein
MFVVIPVTSLPHLVCGELNEEKTLKSNTDIGYHVFLKNTKCEADK